MVDIVEFIKLKEDFSAEPYWDNQQWSIGYGSYAGSRDPKQKPNITVNKTQADVMFRQQLNTYVDSVNKYDSKYNWTPNERDALTSFAYNIGSIDQLTQNGTRNKAQIAQKMLEYHKETKNGVLVENNGLLNRRKQEQQIFLGGANIENITPGQDDGSRGSSSDGALPEALAGGEAGGTGTSGSSGYIENPLNKFDSYTYNWTIYIVHPLNAHKDPASLTEGNETIILSQTGVDNEISIESVVQDMALSFANENRNAIANQFAMTFLEPGGFTMFNRIVYAAERLGIENHLQSSYILKLELVGWSGNSSSVIGPYYYKTILQGLTFDFKDGASTYYGNFIEVKEQAFSRLELHLKQDLTILDVETFGDFLGKFQEEHNKQLEEQLKNDMHRLETDRYIYATAEEWGGWKFDQVDPAALESTEGISVSGNQKLSFTFSQGTAINSALALALFQTKNFKKILTDKGGFIKDDPDAGEANPPKLAELTKWLKVKTDIKYFMYDALNKRYAKEITYSVDSIIAPTLMHDPVSHDSLHRSKTTQRDRLRNMFDKGLIKKRLDYTFTGLNTEVIDLEVKLDTAYYAIQSLNRGALRGTHNLFVGSSRADQQETNRTKQKSDKLKDAKESAISQLSSLTKENESLERRVSVGDFDPNSSTMQTFKKAQAKINALKDKISSLSIQISEAELSYQRALEQMRAGYGASQNLPAASSKYITQSDLYSGGSTDFNEALPHLFEFAPVNSLATSGPDKKMNDIGSSMLGAMELNLNAIGDLMQQQIFIRGDPYWLANGGGAAYETGGVSYFLNLNFPTYPNPVTGLIDSISSDDSIGQFTITGVYVVQQVQARYDNGQFIMLLKSYRDVNTNSNLLYEELLKGYVSGSSRQQAPNTTANTEDNTSTVSPDTDAAGSASNPVNTGTNANHRLAPDLNSDLSNVLVQSADATGVTMQTTSGVRTSGNTRSGRHGTGNASDTALFVDGRRLSVGNPADRAKIAEFSQAFYNNATAQGLNPSIGWADHTEPQSDWYMSGNTGHYDISAGRDTRSGNRGISQAYWGNGERSARAPSWLRNIYR